MKDLLDAITCKQCKALQWTEIETNIFQKTLPYFAQHNKELRLKFITFLTIWTKVLQKTYESFRVAPREKLTSFVWWFILQS